MRPRLPKAPPLVSVLLPIYNTEKYLTESLTSLLEQTYSNLEIIAIDDASTDGSFEILQAFATQNPQVRAFKNESNLGICRTLNHALTLAQGDYIARMDADDIAMEDRIRLQVEFLESNPDCSLVGVCNLFVDVAGQAMSTGHFPCTYQEVDRVLLLTSPVSHNWVCRLEAYQRLGGYRDMAPVEDYDFLLRLKSECLKFVNIPYIGMKIRQTDSGISAMSGLRQKRAFNYAISLYRRRRKGISDGFNRERFLAYVNASGPMSTLYQKAYRLNAIALQIKARRPLASALLKILSAFMSPHQIQYFARRLLMKAILSQQTGGMTKESIR